MGTSKQIRNGCAAFFALTFLLSAPLYVLNTLGHRELLGVPDLGAAYITALTFMPGLAAVLLTWRASGWMETKALLVRVFDYQLIGSPSWLVVAVLLGPAIFAMSLGLMTYWELPVPPAMVAPWAFPLLLAFVFLLAAGEELGWMGYAFGPMLEPFGALRASVLIGAIWAIWHAPFFAFLFPDPVVFSAELATLVVARILLVWVFLNAGKSVFVATLYHATDNAAFMMLPDVKGVVPLGSVVHLSFAIAVVCIVVVLWEPQTLTDLRRRSGPNSPG